MVLSCRHKGACAQNRVTALASVVLALIVLTAFDARGAWIVNGSALPPSAGGVIDVTGPTNNQVGAAWMDTPVDLANSFDISMVVNLGDRDSNGADGLSIVFQNAPSGTNALGDLNDGGRWIGMHGIYPALAVEIDTWYNTENGNEFNDQPEDHVGINLLYNAGSLLNHAAAGPVQALAGSGNIEDGADHLVRLLWNSATTTLTVYVDGVQRLSYSNNIVASLFGGTSAVWFGVTGSTGGAYNLQQFKAQLAGSELWIGKSAAPSAVAPAGLVTYTVTVQNSSSVTAFINQVEDLMPAGFIYQPGTTSGLTTSDPIISGQTLTWNGGWLLAPGQTQTLSFQAQSTAIPGVYANTATLRGDNFADAATGPTAQVTVGSGGSPPASGAKSIYLYSTPGLDLSRTPPAAGQSQVQINGNQNQTWTLIPALASELTISAGTIPMDLWIRGDWRPWVEIELFSAALGGIGTVPGFRATWSAWQFTALNMTIASTVTLPAGDTLQLRIRNDSSQFWRTLYVHPYQLGRRSHFDLDCQTVINVDSVLFYDAPYAGGTQIASSPAGRTISIRAQVSDPFGSFDISSARLILTSPTSAVVVDTTSWTNVIDSGGATILFEYLLTLPALNADGQWRAEVTAEEGSEGLVRHTGAGTLQVFSPPSIMLLKSVRAFSDPVNGTVDPRAIPGAVMEYTITATNTGGAGMDSDSIAVTDVMPANTVLYVGDLGQPSGPVAFIDGSPASGLTYSGSGGDIAYSNSGPPYTYTYTPVPDPQGFDPNVTALRINPKGIFNASVSGSNPQFTLQFRVRLK